MLLRNIEIRDKIKRKDGKFNFIMIFFRGIGPHKYIKRHSLSKRLLKFQCFSCLCGGDYFASLRARASSREARVSFCEPQKIPAKKSKTYIMLPHGIYYMWGCLTMPNYIRERWNDVFRLNRASQEELGSNHFSFLCRIPYIRETEEWTDRFVKNGTADFGRTVSIEGDPEYSGRKKVKWTFPFVSDRN